MSIKAADVKKLRDQTGAGMMECKKALTEANGDFGKAEKILKELGLAAAAKRSGRATNQGRISSYVGDKKASILELVCETDFVARNDDFVKLSNDLAKTIVDKELTEVNDELTDKVNTLMGTIKENMSLKRFSVMDIADDELVKEYIHGEGSIGVLVKLKSDNPEVLKDAKIAEFVFDCALHIAAFNPTYLDRTAVSADYLAEQEGIFRKQAENMGKPEKVIEGIIKGKMNKHLSEICFLDQPFVKDDKQSVTKVMNALGKELGAKLSIVDYKYYRVGDEA